jgi:hypothetical protein
MISAINNSEALSIKLGKNSRLREVTQRIFPIKKNYSSAALTFLLRSIK